MKNLFSLSSEPFWAEISSLPPYNKINKIKNLSDYVLNHIPLYISTENKATLNSSNLSIEQLADICIDICRPFFTYPELQSSQKSSLISPLNQVKNAISINPEKSIKLNEEISFSQHLKSFLLCSFIYRQSQQSETIPIEHSDIANSPFFNNTYVKESATIISNRISVFNNKKTDFFTQFSSVPPNAKYLDFFINYTQNKINFTSWYDINIFLGLTATTKSSENPYMQSNKLKDNSCDLKKFLSHFSKFISFGKHISNKDDLTEKPIKSFIDLENFVNYQNEQKAISLYCSNDNNCTKKKLPFIPQINHFPEINNFLIEKVTCVNFINTLYRYKNDFNNHKSDMDSIFELSLYPLLSYRNTLAFDLITLFGSGINVSPAKLNTTIHNIIRHQIFCSFPILDMVFHALLLKYNLFFTPIPHKTLSEFLTPTENLFSYEFDSDTSNFPIKLHPKISFPLNQGHLNSDYYKISSEVFDLLGSWTILQERNNYFSVLLNDEHQKKLMLSFNLDLNTSQIGTLNYQYKNLPFDIRPDA